MKQKLMFIAIFLASVTNSYALMQTSLAEHQGDIINLLVWCVVTMGAALVSLTVYQFNALRKEVSSLKQAVEQFNGRLIVIETKDKMREEE